MNFLLKHPNIFAMSSAEKGASMETAKGGKEVRDHKREKERTFEREIRHVGVLNCVD